MILPSPAPGFAWRDTPFGAALVCVPLEAVAPHVFTTRFWEPSGERAEQGASPDALTVPASDDRPGETDVWSKAAAAIGLATGALVRMKQVHGNAVTRASRETAGERFAADIAVCGDSGLGVAVQAADCVPLLIADRRLGVVAAAHAGWRGLAQRVPLRTVQALNEAFGSQPADMIVAIGPSVGACCYEVGSEVRRACEERSNGADDLARWFTNSPRAIRGNASMPGLPDRPRPGHEFFDGWVAAYDQLVAAGVPAADIHGACLCTASHSALFWSYRREGSRAKRLVAAIRSLRGVADVA